MMEKFWMVYGPGSRDGPKVQHVDAESARQEANRSRELPKQAFALVYIGTWRIVVPVRVLLRYERDNCL